MRTLADNYATPIAARPAPHPQSALQLASRSAASRHNGCRRRSDRRRCSSAFRQRRQVLAATGRIVQWGLESRWINPGGTGEANPCSFWCGGRAKAKRKRNFSDGHIRALAQGGQAQGHPDGPHDPDPQRQDVQGVQSRLPQDPPPARQGVLPRHGRHRQGTQPIQVDGGSEFRADFEDECAERGLPSRCSRRTAPNSTASSSGPTEPQKWSSDGEHTCEAVNAALAEHLDYYNN